MITSSTAIIERAHNHENFLDNQEDTPFLDFPLSISCRIGEISSDISSIIEDYSFLAKERMLSLKDFRKFFELVSVLDEKCSVLKRITDSIHGYDDEEPQMCATDLLRRYRRFA